MTKRYPESRHERAVSPVVGVMLMLVVTIAVAATVSGFAGSLAGDTAKKAPTLSMDVKVVNTGNWHGSGFFATVTSVSEPIPTKDIKIVTSYNAETSQNARIERLAPSRVSGGNTTLPGSSNINVLFDPGVSIAGKNYTAPFGFGPGVNGTEGADVLSAYSAPMQQFGNYTLVAGTTMVAFPCGAADSSNVTGSAGSQASSGYGVATQGYYGPASEGGAREWINRYGYTPYDYVPSSNNFIDPAKAVLGTNWYYLQWGNSVNVKVIYIPTGNVIFNQDVPVTEQ
jgi:archaeal type IV pilus assembly protein PilA